MAMTLRLSDDLDQQVSDFAQNAGISKNQVVIDAIEAHIRQAIHKQRVQEAIEKVVTRDAELLERLADA